MTVQKMVGVGLKWNRLATWKMALTKVVPEDLEFRFYRSLKAGFSGFSTKII